MIESITIPERDCWSPALSYAGVDYLCRDDNEHSNAPLNRDVESVVVQMPGYDFTAVDAHHLHHQTATQQSLSSPQSLLELLLDPTLRSTDSSIHSEMVPEPAPEAQLTSDTPRTGPSAVEPNRNAQRLATATTANLSLSSDNYRITESSSQDDAQGDRTLKRKGSQRRHYAVEKRYRSTLNSKYAALARTVSSEAAQRICRTESPDWAMHLDRPPSFGSGEEAAAGATATARTTGTTANPQRKTATLSATIDTISVLTRCCLREAGKLEQLKKSVQEVRHRMQQVLDGNPLNLESPLAHCSPPQQRPAAEGQLRGPASITSNDALLDPEWIRAI